MYQRGTKPYEMPVEWRTKASAQDIVEAAYGWPAAGGGRSPAGWRHLAIAIVPALLHHFGLSNFLGNTALERTMRKQLLKVANVGFASILSTFDRDGKRWLRTSANLSGIDFQSGD